jgi:hypothetical protein
MIQKNATRPLKFNIRSTPSLQYDGLENDMVEAAYDTVNRMMILMGDIPFGEFLAMPWVKLSLSCRVPDMHAAGLLNDPAAVYAAFDVLEAAGQMSFSSYINGDVYRDGTDTISLALRTLNRQGILLPTLRSKPNTNKKTVLALNDIVSLASDLTYFSVFTESIPDYARLDAVRAAMKQEIFALPPNSKCCDVNTNSCTGGATGQTCYYCGGGSGTSYC